MELVLPRTTVTLLGKVQAAQRNPGLQLDKFSIPGDQTQQKAALAKVCLTAGDKQLLAAFGQRQRDDAEVSARA